MNADIEHLLPDPSILTEKILLPNAPSPNLLITDEPLLNPNPVPPDKNPDTIINQIPPQVGFDSGVDIATIYLASQVACPTGLDIPINDYLNAKYLLTETKDSISNILPNPVESDVDSSSIPSSMPIGYKSHSDEEDILSNF